MLLVARLRLAGALALGTALGGCTAKACDDDKLRAAVDAHRQLPTAEYVEQIGAACPKMPPVLEASLHASMRLVGPDIASTVYAGRVNDPAWTRLRERACPTSAVPTPPGLDRYRATRLRCNFDRFGVLDPDDPYVSRDFDVFVLLAWLQDVGVPSDLAARVVGPLLAASATDEQLWAICVDGGGGCETVLARRGLHPPRSTSEMDVAEGIEIEITRSEIRVASESVLPLRDGRLSGDGRHVREPLRAALAPLAGDEPPSIAWIVDADVEYGTFIDAAFTASKAGLDEGQLVVLDYGVLRGLPLAWPWAWRRPNGERRDAPPPATSVAVTTDGATLRVMDDATHAASTTTLPSRCDRGSECARALSEAAARVKRQRPHETVVEVAASDDVRMQRVIDVVDALRGADCRGRMLDTGAPIDDDDCLLWQPLFDASPGLFFHVDRRGRVTLGAPTVRASRPGTEVPTALADELRTKVTEALPTMTACVDGSPEILRALEGDGDRLVVMYGPAEDDPKQTVARVFVHGFLEDPTQACVLDPLGAKADTRKRKLDFLTEATYEVSLPLAFEDDSAAD